MKLKVNNVPGYSGIINIEDDNGIPIDKFWRNRLEDAKIDNCVEIIKPRAKRTKEKHNDNY